MSGGGENLKALYEAAEQLRTQLDTLQANSEQYRSNLQQLITKYTQCQDLASKASIFSSNEALDDVATGDIKYFSIDFIVAELLARDFTGDRVQLLKRSKAGYARYLSRLDDYEILSQAHKSLYQRFLEDESSFTVLDSNDSSMRRSIKIARFQQETEIKQKVQLLNSDPRIQQDDDSVVRKLRIAEQSLYIHQTFQALDMIVQEQKILSMAPPPQSDAQTSSSDPRQNARNGDGQYSERLDGGLASMRQNGKSGPLLSKSGRPLQPFTLLDTRERLRSGVFKSGHNLPTMTIDEYLEEERRRGGIIEGGGEPPVMEPNEDDFEAADRDTMKAREWDDFVEANTKGSGNTLNRG